MIGDYGPAMAWQLTLWFHLSALLLAAGLWSCSSLGRAAWCAEALASLVAAAVLVLMVVGAVAVAMSGALEF